MQLIVDRHGAIHAIYGETIDLAVLGELTIRRASHVEPDQHGRWWADLAPIDGTRRGSFHGRSDALAAEQDWLEQNRHAWIEAAEIRAGPE